MRPLSHFRLFTICKHVNQLIYVHMYMCKAPHEPPEAPQEPPEAPRELTKAAPKIPKEFRKLSQEVLEVPQELRQFSQEFPDAYIYMCISVRMSIHIYICMNVDRHLHIYVHMCACVFVCVKESMNICMACIYVQCCTYMYTYVYM